VESRPLYIDIKKVFIPKSKYNFRILPDIELD